MILKNDKVLLRAIDEQDAEILMELINDPEVENAVYGWSRPVSLSSQKQWILNQNDESTIRYAIEYEKQMVGVGSISSIDMKNRVANLNIKLLKDYRGKRIATNAIKLLIHYCFEELNCHCLTANVLERNTDSKRLWERFGFHQDGLLRERVYKNGRYHNIIAFSLLKEDFYERNR